MAETMRLDRFLWFARLSSSRAVARALAESGHLRIDGRPIAKAAASVRPGNVLTFATHHGAVRVICVEALPARRGPALEAQTCYAELTPPASKPIAKLDCRGEYLQ